MRKLRSRKFWICVATVLASVGTAIAGLNCESETLVVVGVICAMASGAIYNVCEALVDMANEESEG